MIYWIYKYVNVVKYLFYYYNIEEGLKKDFVFFFYKIVYIL